MDGEPVAIFRLDGRSSRVPSRANISILVQRPIFGANSEDLRTAVLASWSSKKRASIGLRHIFGGLDEDFRQPNQHWATADLPVAVSASFVSFWI
jgi:hypothetical protein